MTSPVLTGPEWDALDCRLQRILEVLDTEYPDRRPMLNYRNAYELCVGVLLSAQTTDKAVNATTPELFQRWPEPAALAQAPLEELEKVIHRLGFFRRKSEHLKELARRLVEHFDGEVPESMEDLVSLPGIGRKSANVIRMHIWDRPGIIVDTHFGRVCRRLGLTSQSDPVKVEREIEQLLPPFLWSMFSMTVNYHGRRDCHSRKPDCFHCSLEEWCPRCGVR